MRSPMNRVKKKEGRIGIGWVNGFNLSVCLRKVP